MKTEIEDAVVTLKCFKFDNCQPRKKRYFRVAPLLVVIIADMLC